MVRSLFLHIVILCSCGFSLFSEEKPHQLALADIPNIMDRIFLEHVTQKKMDDKIMARAIKLFVDQFDPGRSYLLAIEVAQFTNLPDEKLAVLIKDYEKHNFSFFYRMVQQFQQAIKRAREIREKELYRNFKEIELAILNASKDPVLSELAPFPQSKDDLSARIRIRMARFINAMKMEKEAKGQKANFDDCVRQLETETEESENNYLYLNQEGKPLEVHARENLFAFQVLKAFTSSLDAHSNLLNPQEALQLRIKLQKGYDGVGLEVEEKARRFLVSKFVQGSTAEKSGSIQIGDRIIAIDGSPTTTMDLSEVVDQLQGTAGTYVTLTMERPKQPPYEVMLERKKIIIKEGRVDTSFEKDPDGIIGKIALHSFYEGDDVSSVNDMKKALEDLAKKGPIKGLILDLRDNRGGFLIQAVKVAGIFLKSGVVVVSKTADGKEHFFRDLDPSCEYSGPLVILTSKVTASAAEIVAQSLKDWGVAIVVGDDRTYGKGSVQMQNVTTSKTDPSLKVTIGRYYSVSGQSPQDVGVKADIVVPSAIFDKKLGESYLHFPLDKDSISDAYQDQLADVEPEMKEWFVKYYLPFVQEKGGYSEELIGELKKRSKARLKAQDDYVRFLNKKPLMKKVEKDGKTEMKEMTKEEAQRRIWELQMQEACSIVRDIAALTKTKSS
jgi:carboxyl-terminal processing protease